MIFRISAVGALVFALSVVTAPAAQALTCGQVVTGFAVLTQDLTCTGHGISVGAPGTTIDLNGFTIMGDRDPGDFGIDAFNGHDDVTVRNGVLQNFEYGIAALNGSDRFRVDNVVVSGNAEDGMWISGDSAFVTSSTAAGNRGIGVNVAEGPRGQVNSTVATGNGLSGIALGERGQANSSIASGNRSFGITGFADFVSITASTASGNGFSPGMGSAGILVLGNASSIVGNRADGNGLEAGLASDKNGFGISVANYTIPPSGTNVARGNDNPAQCDPAFLC